MSSPMPDLPEHLRIGVNQDGDGPVAVTSLAYSHDVCWCGRPGCTAYEQSPITVLMSETPDQTGNPA